MSLTPESYAEICKQTAFISAVVAGFSFAFLGALLVSPIKSKMIDWTIIFSILSIAGLLICSLAWTLSASRMALYSGANIELVPQTYISLHRTLSFIFILSFMSFLVTLGISGWIRSRKIGIISSSIALVATVFFITIMTYFVK